MSSLTRRIQRTLTRRKPSGLIAFGTRLGVTNEVKRKYRAPRGRRRKTKPSSWRAA